MHDWLYDLSAFAKCIISYLAVIAESDDIYTLTLLGVNRNVYKDKTVLILGGGDGGLLHELLKMSPKHVLMVEISFFTIL